MSSPVTHGQLRAELGELRSELRAELSELRTDMLSAIAASEHSLEARMHSVIDSVVAASEQRLSSELARHITAICEPLASQVSVIDA